ncbi:MAG: hypothetical protein J1E62_06135 [Lachnospiraceae bacterium]|nr:hypothetical protein [Lachnospiraceae bacterium]
MKKRLLCALLTVSLLLSQAVSTMIFSTTTARAEGEEETFKGTSPFTSSTYTHAAKFNGMNVYHGIDVSYHNDNSSKYIDWKKVAAAGVEYAIIRVGYRGYGSGTLVEDPRYERNIKGALENGIAVGLYFFTEAKTNKEAKEEADFCLKLAKDYDITLPIAFDYEYQYVNGKNVSRKYGLSKAKATSNCRVFCDTIYEGGYTPMIYANISDLTNTIDGAALEKDYMVWLANYTTKTSYTGLYDIWQYSSSGSVDGIPTRVDCNFWYSDTDIGNMNFNSGDLKDAEIDSIATQTYTGSEIKPTVSVKLNKRALKLNRDYTVSYSDNKKPGKATVTITGKGNITGTRKKTFKINPKAVSSLSAKSATKKITLTWKGSTGGEGYEIWRTNVYSGEYKKVKTIKTASTKKFANSNLGNDREYFYKVRAYRKVDGVYYYSAFTKISAGTTPGGKAFIAPSKLILLKKPSATSGKRVTIPANATAVYLGRTVLADKTKFYHIQYLKNGTVYDGYLAKIKGIKLRKMKTTTAKTELKADTTTSSKTLAKISKKTPIAIMKTITAKNKTWYKTMYLKGTKVYTGYVCADTLD